RPRAPSRPRAPRLPGPAMGKKGERGAKEKTAAALEEEARNAEYQCTGVLEQDFAELCARAGFQEIPKVVMRPHPHAVTPVPPVSAEEPDPQAEREGQSILLQTQWKYNYFRPAIQVEQEHEDPRSTREIFIRTGWKIEEKMLAVFAKCLPALAHLQAIHLWKVGLTDETFLSLLSILTLALEGNPLPMRSFYKLISEETNLAHLSLRNNNIDDEAVLLMGQALSSLRGSNKNLVSINLSYNHITDVGATHIANVRLVGAEQPHCPFGRSPPAVLGPFALTHTEVVERRRLLLEKECQERCRLPQRHSETKSERPTSHLSNTAIDKLQAAKTTKATNKKKVRTGDSVFQEPAKKEEKGQVSGAAVVQAAAAAQAKKDDAKQAKKGPCTPLPLQPSVRGKGTKSGNKDKRTQVLEVEVTEPTEMVNPLLEPAEYRDGKVFLPGNRVLIYLNLMRNRITETGLKAFLATVEQQASRVTSGGRGPVGLLRLSLGKNSCPADSKTLARIQELMMLRDPLPKTGAATRAPEEELAAAL
uniref:Leucine rich repeat containing 71 n=1 Tax=Varanus komodoensis TaxID=61221 RepID=A0A8D2IMX5_VARKO